ncbi:hypothetical protein GIB67_016336, partial [Kingdonia uniflora]
QGSRRTYWVWRCFQEVRPISIESKRPSSVYNDETIVVKFVDTAIVGKSEAEDACHHGSVGPTINLKEAMNDINNDVCTISWLLVVRDCTLSDSSWTGTEQKTLDKQDRGVSSRFEVFVDESLDNEMDFSYHNKENVDATLPKKHNAETHMLLQQTFEIYVDGDDNGIDIEDYAPRVHTFVFPRPNDGSTDTHMNSSANLIHKEDTVVGRFVGSVVADKPEVENACQHGLVELTINLKEAMETISGMFGKPLDFMKINRSKKQGKFVEKREDCDVFSILPDDDLKSQQQLHASLCSSSKLGSWEVVNVSCLDQLCLQSRPWMISMRCLGSHWTSSSMAYFRLVHFGCLLFFETRNIFYDTEKPYFKHCLRLFCYHLEVLGG